MSGSEGKDKIIGFLASIIIHAVIIGLFALIAYNYDKENQKTKVDRKTLNLSQFKSQTDEMPTPKREAKKTPPPTKNTKTAKKQPQKKEATKPIESKQKRDFKESNATAKSTPQKSSKPSGSLLLSELNKQFKTMKKEVGGPIKKLYGEEFERLGKEEQKFIKDNLGSIGRITEKYLRYPDVAGQLGQEGTSVVEFFLHPNGDISDLRLIGSSSHKMLDKNSVETIEIAYKDYPRPTVKTKIRMYVGYSIY